MKPAPQMMAFLALVIAAVFWGSSFLVIQQTMVHDIWWMLCFRHFFGALGTFLLFRKQALKLPRKDLKLTLIISFWILVTFAPQAIGLTGTSIANSAVITALFVVFTPVIMFLMKRAKPTTMQWVGSLIGISAFLLLGISQGFTQLGFYDFLTLVTSIAVAFHVIYFTEAVSTPGKLASIVFYQFFLSGIILALFATTNSLSQETFFQQSFSPKEWAGLAYLGLFSMALPYTLQGYAQTRLNPVQVVLVISSEPLWAIGVANLLRGDPVSGAALMASFILIIANLVAELKIKRR